MGLLQVFYAPEKLFAELPEKRAWLLPLTAAMLLSLLTAYLVINMVGMETITRNAIESNSHAVEQLGQQKIDEMVHDSASPGRKMLSYAVALALPPISLLVVAGVFLAMLSITDAPARFGRVLAVVGYTYFAYALVTGIMTLVALKLMSDYSGVDVQNVARLNATIFLDKSSTPKLLYSVLSSLDVLSFCAIFLYALGLSKVAQKLSLSRAFVVVLIPWAILVLCKAAWASIFG